MTKILYDKTQVDMGVIQKLKTCEDTLKKASSYASNIRILYSFDYSDYLSSIRSKIDNFYYEISSITTNLKKLEENLNITYQELDRDLKFVDNLIIESRPSITK